jgi:hypothetical protein
MQDFLKTTAENLPTFSFAVIVRLIAAAAFGFGVAWIYRRTRPASDVGTSFPATLVLLAPLITMVTSVIGDSTARAFSLVGALSIVRFRTVVRDTQDTAFVIFTVGVGMAMGATPIQPWVAIAGMIIVGGAAFLLRPRPSAARLGAPLPYLVRVRVGLGHDVEKLASGVFSTYMTQRRIRSIETAKQGISIDVTYEAALKEDNAAAELVATLNKLDGVQDVQIERRDLDQEET